LFEIRFLDLFPEDPKLFETERRGHGGDVPRLRSILERDERSILAVFRCQQFLAGRPGFIIVSSRRK
jgi:hypothetical protein